MEFYTMAMEQVVEGLQFSPKAGADLRTKVFYFAKMSGDDTVVLAAAGTDQVVGVIREGGNTNDPVTVQFGGMGKAIAGGTIVAGNRITADGSGKAVATTSAADKVIGVAIQGADAADIFSFLFIPGHVAAS
jgi:hypothetical protein